MEDMVGILDMVVNIDMEDNVNMVDSIDILNMQKNFGYLQFLVGT